MDRVEKGVGEPLNPSLTWIGLGKALAKGTSVVVVLELPPAPTKWTWRK